MEDKVFAILAALAFIATLACIGVGASTGDILYRVAPGIWTAAQSGVQEVLGLWFWQNVVSPVLMLPAWSVPALLTVMFALTAVLPRLTEGSQRPRII